MKDDLNDDETTLLLILDWVSAWQKQPIAICDGVKEIHLQLSDLDGLRMHLLVRDIAHELLDTGVQSLASSFGLTNLEELLLQTMKRLLQAFFNFNFLGIWTVLTVFRILKPACRWLSHVRKSSLGVISGHLSNLLSHCLGTTGE
jgi:hypothetical protein